MTQEFIAQIKAAEEQAKSILHEGEQKARALLDSARAEGSVWLEEKKAGLRAAAQQKVALLEEEGQVAYSASLGAAKKATDSEMAGAKKKMSLVVQQGVQFLKGKLAA